MANTAKPKSDNISEISKVSVPVGYSTPTGLALLLSSTIVSDKKVVPFVRTIPTASFISGNYSFPVPNGYVARPYQLPMLEPQTWNVVANIISAYQPVELYQIGNKSYVNDQGITVPADLMKTTFSINIYPGTYSNDTETIKPLELNQSVIIRIYKNAGVAINWQSSNILNNGLTDAAIQSATELTFVITNILGKYQVTEWITPDFILTNLSTLPTTAKTNLAAIVTELYNKSYPPTGAAGGDLAGNYPNPSIGTGKVTNAKLAGGITADKLAAGVIPSSLPPSGAAGRGLSGSYPNPSIGSQAVSISNLTAALRDSLVFAYTTQDITGKKTFTYPPTVPTLNSTDESDRAASTAFVADAIRNAKDEVGSQYIKFASGVMIQWGASLFTNGVATISFAHAFASKPNISVSPFGTSSSQILSTTISSISLDKFIVLGSYLKSGSSMVYVLSSGNVVSWSAIGFWKI